MDIEGKTVSFEKTYVTNDPGRPGILFMGKVTAKMENKEIGRVGFEILHRRGTEIGPIQAPLEVEEGFRQKGLGRALVEETLNYVRELIIQYDIKNKSAVAAITPSNEHARKILVAVGFKSVRGGLQRGNGYSESFMKKLVKK